MTAPAWFTDFLKDFHDINNKNVTAIQELTARVTTLETTVNTKLEQVETEIVAIKQELTGMKKEKSKEKQIVDSCEVIVSGIPAECTLNNSEVVNKIFAVLDTPNLHQFVFETREWKGKYPQQISGNRSQSDVNAGTSYQLTINENEVGDPTTTPSVNNQYRALVIKFCSPCTRDALLTRCPKLENINCHTLFGVGGTYKIFIRPILPQPLYKLWCAALETHKKLNYARPIIRNLTVFMRETKRSPLIDISNELELVKLPPYLAPA